jgi:hypothetical protein
VHGSEFQVTLYLDIDEDLYHTSYVHTGIFSLASSGEVSLTIKRPTVGTWRKSGIGNPCVALDVRAPGGRVIPVSIDLRDRSDLFDHESLENAAVYFKRSYHGPDVAALPAAHRSKVLPFGLNFVCADNASSRAVFAQALSRIGTLLLRPSADTKDGVKRLLRKVYDHWSYRRESDYLAPPSKAKTPAVLFQTRLWEKHEALGDDSAAINEERIVLVRALRRAFGNRFAGGLVPTPIAVRNHPDLLTQQPTTPAAFANWQRSFLIGVYTRGLHHSTAWKLGEYFAGSMCVVATPARNVLPKPLTPGVHYLSFSSPDECIARCESIFGDPTRQDQMREAAYSYYKSEVAPANHLRNCLSRAIRYSEDKPASAR